MLPPRLLSLALPVSRAMHRCLFPLMKGRHRLCRISQRESVRRPLLHARASARASCPQPHHQNVNPLAYNNTGIVASLQGLTKHPLGCMLYLSTHRRVYEDLVRSSFRFRVFGRLCGDSPIWNNHDYHCRKDGHWWRNKNHHDRRSRTAVATTVNDRLRAGSCVFRLSGIPSISGRADVLRTGGGGLHQLPTWPLAVVNDQASQAPFFGGARFFIFKGTITFNGKEDSD